MTEQAAINGQPVSVIAFDIDEFKAINDQHGHAAGDIALRDLAHALRRSLRTFELLYRVGGDEFLLLLPGASGREAVAIAESLCRSVVLTRPLGVALTCSFGVATAPTDGEVKQVMRDADAALCLAKHNGRNRVERHDASAEPIAA